MLTMCLPKATGTVPLLVEAREAAPRCQGAQVTDRLGGAARFVFEVGTTQNERGV